MSYRKGLTSWVWRTATMSVAIRWNMTLAQAIHTFTILRGGHVLACGPVIVEW